MGIHVSRRRFGMVAGGALASFACGGHAAAEGDDGRLAARPPVNVSTTAKGGRLGLDGGRDAILQLPAKAPEGPLALLVMLHGAGGSGEGILRRVGAAADEAGIAVFAPDSRGPTWDAIRGGFGPDVTFIDRALTRVFDTVSIDAARVAVGGFSDGASYALSLGLINGDLFPSVVAFSPGFVVSGTTHGKPRFFFSHGTADPILPIGQSSRVIVPRLQSLGYEVTLHEFEGGHQVPADIAAEAMRWLVATPPAKP